MPSIRSKIVDLVSIAAKADKTLKTISRASTNASLLRTGAIYGSLGFGVGAGGTFAALASASMLIYAPFAVPLVGIWVVSQFAACRRLPRRRHQRSSERLQRHGRNAMSPRWHVARDILIGTIPATRRMGSTSAAEAGERAGELPTPSLGVGSKLASSDTITRLTAGSGQDLFRQSQLP